MTEIPSWWLYLSGAFFLSTLLLVIALIVLVIKLLQTFKSLEPQIVSLTHKVDSIAGKVDDISTSVKETLVEVGGKTRNVAISAENIAGAVAGTMGKFAPIVSGIMMAMKLFHAYKDARAPHDVEKKPLPDRKGKHRR